MTFSSSILLRLGAVTALAGALCAPLHAQAGSSETVLDRKVGPYALKLDKTPNRSCMVSITGRTPARVLSILDDRLTAPIIMMAVEPIKDVNLPEPPQTVTLLSKDKVGTTTITTNFQFSQPKDNMMFAKATISEPQADMLLTSGFLMATRKDGKSVLTLLLPATLMAGVYDAFVKCRQEVARK